MLPDTTPMENPILDTSPAQQEAPNANNLVYSTFGARFTAAAIDSHGFSSPYRQYCWSRPKL